MKTGKLIVAVCQVLCLFLAYRMIYTITDGCYVAHIAATLLFICAFIFGEFVNKAIDEGE